MIIWFVLPAAERDLTLRSSFRRMRRDGRGIRFATPSKNTRRLALTRGSLPVGVGTHGFPMGRLVRAEEIADVIVFTAGPKLA